MKNTVLLFLLIANFGFGQELIEGKFCAKKNLFQQNKIEYWISEFEGDFAKFSKTGYTGIINKEGKIILPMEYDKVYISDSLFYGSKKSKYYIFSTKGEPISVPIYDYIVKNNGIIYSEYFQKYHPIKLVGNPFLRYQIYQYGNAILDFNGKIIAEIPDNITVHFYDGVSAINNGRFRDKKYGYINTKGEIILPMQYDYCGIFRNRRGIVTLGNKRGVVDNLGNFIIPFTTNITPSSFYSNNLCRYRDSTSRKFGYLDTNGHVTIQPKYNKADNFNKGFAKVEENGAEYIIDVKGKKYKTKQYSFVDGYRFQPYKNKVVYEDKNGKVVFDFKYENHPTSIHFIEGLAKVKLNGKEGVIDRLGNEIVPPIYDRIKIDQGYILVKDKNDIWLMSKSGKKIKKILENTLQKESNSPNFTISIGFNENGFLITRKDNKFGLINANTITVLPNSFDDIYVNKYYIIATTDNKMGVYNFTGELMIPHEVQKIVSETDKGFVIKSKKKLTLFDKEFNMRYSVDSIDFNYPSRGTPYPSGIYPYKNIVTGKQGYLDVINIDNSEAIYDGFIFYRNHIIICKRKNENVLFKPIPKEKVNIKFDLVNIVSSNIFIIRKKDNGPKIAIPGNDFWITSGNEWVYGIMNQDGKIILPIQYFQIKNISFFKDRTIIIPKGAMLFTYYKNQYVFINKYGKVIP